MCQGRDFLWGCIDRGICRGKMLFTFGHRSMLHASSSKNVIDMLCRSHTDIDRENRKYFYSKGRKKGWREIKGIEIFFFLTRNEEKWNRNDSWKLWMEWTILAEWFVIRESYLNFFLNVNHLFNFFQVERYGDLVLFWIKEEILRLDKNFFSPIQNRLIKLTTFSVWRRN